MLVFANVDLAICGYCIVILTREKNGGKSCKMKKISPGKKWPGEIRKTENYFLE